MTDTTHNPPTHAVFIAQANGFYKRNVFFDTDEFYKTNPDKYRSRQPFCKGDLITPDSYPLLWAALHDHANWEHRGLTYGDTMDEGKHDPLPFLIVKKTDEHDGLPCKEDHEAMQIAAIGQFKAFAESCASPSRRGQCYNPLYIAAQRADSTFGTNRVAAFSGTISDSA